ncbi:MAG: glutathione S-transferase family protein [Deltaproteobacteria bacterium]|nr:glutathione S-transferase family protein [Deltaproteobacteria bacterium]
MKLYSGPLSLFSAKARIALGEKGIGHELIQVGWSRSAAYEPHHPDVVALNPKREVPVLVDGDVVVCDSSLIFEYLEERCPDPPLYPAGTAARARCRAQEWVADEVWFPDLWTLIAAGVYGNGSGDAVPGAILALQARAHELESALGTNDYFCGTFTVADIGSYVFLSTAIALGAPLPADVPRVAAWLARVAARPAVAAVMLDVNAAAARLLAA